MPFHDLNVPYNTNHADLCYTLAFAAELGYAVVAVCHNVVGKLPAKLDTIPVPAITASATSSSLLLPSTILTRITLTVSDTSQNHRLNSLQAAYDVVALRPTDEKSFQLCCNDLECDIISLDFSQRLLFPIKFTTAASAFQRGLRFEICYSAGVTGSNQARRNLISGAASLIRATRGRGIILSSEAKNALGLRGPWDVVNLAQIWGLDQERAKEGLCDECERVVQLASFKRTSFRGVVDLVANGSQPTYRKEPDSNETKNLNSSVKEIMSEVPSKTATEITATTTDGHSTKDVKRKASQISSPVVSQRQDLDEEQSEVRDTTGEPVSKREMKRRAKKARLGGYQEKDMTVGLEKDMGKSVEYATRHETGERS